MRSENMELRAHIANIEQKLSDQGKVVSTLETKLYEGLKWANKNKQYSR